MFKALDLVTIQWFLENLYLWQNINSEVSLIRESSMIWLKMEPIQRDEWIFNLRLENHEKFDYLKETEPYHGECRES